eukprot:147781-Prymnesium_polylepis.2
MLSMFDRPAEDIDMRRRPESRKTMLCGHSRCRAAWCPCVLLGCFRSDQYHRAGGIRDTVCDVRGVTDNARVSCDCKIGACKMFRGPCAQHAALIVGHCGAALPFICGCPDWGLVERCPSRWVGAVRGGSSIHHH